MKLGLIGTSAIAEKFAQGVQAQGDMQLWAAYSRKQATGVAFAQQFGIPHVFTSLQDLFAAVDIVYIASPNSLHFSQAKAALLAGKHVLVEKAACATYAQTKILVDLAAAKGVYLFEAIRSLHNPNMQNIKNAMAGIGPVRYAYLNHMNYSGKYDAYKQGQQATMFLPEFAGGALYDMGTYNAYMALHLFGRPNSVSYHACKLPSGVDGVSSTVLTYPDKLVILAASKINCSRLHSAIEGENGSVLMEHVGELREVTVIKDTEQTVLHGRAHHNDLIYEIAEIMRIMQKDDKPAYAALQTLMLDVAWLLETARQQAGITFPCDTEA